MPGAFLNGEKGRMTIELFSGKTFSLLVFLILDVCVVLVIVLKHKTLVYAFTAFTRTLRDLFDWKC